MIDDQALVESALQGDDDAFADLVERYQRDVYNLAYRMLSNAGEAEDAGQEAFLKAYTNLSRYDPGRSFKTWLLSITSNHCIDRLRKRRLTLLPIDEPLAPHSALISKETGPEDAVMGSELGAQVQVLLDELAPDYRAAVVLRYWYDMSYIEIADMLETTESAIKSRLFRARQMLAENMQAGSAGQWMIAMENA